MFIYNEKLFEYPEYAQYRKLVLCLDAGMAGTEDYVAYLVSTEVAEHTLEDFAWAEAIEHASTYGIEYSHCPEDNEELEYDFEGYFVEYNEKEHSGKLIFGSNQDFQWTVF